MAPNHDKKGTTGALTEKESGAHVEAAPEQSESIHITRLKEIVMNTDKVIELGKVSEETKGGIGAAESLEFPLLADGG